MDTQNSWAPDDMEQPNQSISEVRRPLDLSAPNANNPPDAKCSLIAYLPPKRLTACSLT